MDGEGRTRTAIGDPPFSSGVFPVEGDARLLMVISCVVSRSASFGVEDSAGTMRAALGRHYCPQTLRNQFTSGIGGRGEEGGGAGRGRGGG